MQPAAQPKPTASRMALSGIVKGRIAKPNRILLFGVEKIGKSTFASEAPAPIFIGAEDGTAQLDVARFPQPESWTDVLDAIQVLSKEPHEYRTAVIDTIDWLEPMLWEHICKRDNKKDVESYGYGKGYIAALDEWRILLSRLDALRAARGMHVILLGHSWIKPYKSPTSNDYDRFELKVHPKAGGLIKEWCDAVLFAQHETFAVENNGRTRGVDSGARIIHTQRRAAWDAGNRLGLPETIPLSWQEFDAAVQAGAPADAEKLALEVNALLEHVDEATRKAALAWLGNNGNARDGQKLAQMADRLRAKMQINQQQTSKEETQS